jgi:hypothetical protein
MISCLKDVLSYYLEEIQALVESIGHLQIRLNQGWDDSFLGSVGDLGVLMETISLSLDHGFLFKTLDLIPPRVLTQSLVN